MGACGCKCRLLRNVRSELTVERGLRNSKIGDHVGGAQDVDAFGCGDDGAAMVHIGEDAPKVR